MKHVQHDKKGFTLIELSIVLAIIALLLGGILVGQSLIRQAQLRSVTTDVARYTQAITSFRDKYLALPGDFSGATALWGAADPTPATCYTTSSTGLQATCDGNGDGRIASATYTTAGQYEQFRAWQHLANAGFIDGQYSGVAGPLGPTDAIPGTNTPASQLPGGGFAIFSVLSSETGISPFSSNYFSSINYGHVLQFGSDMGSTSYAALWPSFSIVSDALAAQPGHPFSTTMGPILTTSEALSLDQKMDDGLPGSGIVMAFQQDSPATPNCTTSDTAASAAYDITQSGRKCSLIFLLGF